MRPKSVPPVLLLCLAVAAVATALYLLGSSSSRREGTGIKTQSTNPTKLATRTNNIGPTGPELSGSRLHSATSTNTSAHDAGGRGASDGSVRRAAKVGDSADGTIKRLPDHGTTTCYALDTKKLPGYAAGDSVSLSLSADGPTALNRLPNYEPRQARFPVAQGGLYYQLIVGEQVVFWGQTGTPGVVAFDTPPQTSEADQLRIQKTLSANATAAIQLPPTTGKAILKVWAVNYETNLENGLGVPIYSIDVPASPGS